MCATTPPSSRTALASAATCGSTRRGLIGSAQNNNEAGTRTRYAVGRTAAPTLLVMDAAGEPKAEWTVQRRKVLRDGLGIGIATGAYALSFGAIATASGLSVLPAVALSTLMFTGASQFAFVGVLGAGGGPLAAAATATLLGSRNAFYGLRLASLLGVRGPRRLVTAHLVIDESTVMAVARSDDRAARVGFWATGCAVFVCWNLGSLIGALGAEALDDPRVLGLDAAVPAAFLALLAPQLRDTQTRVHAVAARCPCPGDHAGSACRAAHPGRRRRHGSGRLAAPDRDEDTVMWLAVLLAAGGCYAFKLAGLSVPRRLLDDPRTQRISVLLPVTLLAALAATQTFTIGQRLVIDARVAAICVAAVAVLLRAPFLVIVGLAAATAALVRLLS